MIEFLEGGQIRIEVVSLMIGMARLAAGGLRRLELAVQAGRRCSFLGNIGVTGRAAFGGNTAERRVTRVAIVLEVGVRLETLQGRRSFAQTTQVTGAKDSAAGENDCHDDAGGQHQTAQAANR